MPDPRGVLITRPAGDAEATASRVASRGYTPVLAPLLTVRTTEVTIPARCGAILLTSGNALPGLAGHGQDLPLFAVGDATAARARAGGFRQVASADGSAADLAALVRAALAPGTRLLLAQGRGQGAALAQALREAGFVVIRRVAYAVAPVARLPDAACTALRQHNLAAAMFLSAETARVFARLLPQSLRPALAGIEALAIGQPAAEILAPLPWRRVRVSLRPTLDQVLALL